MSFPILSVVWVELDLLGDKYIGNTNEEKYKSVALDLLEKWIDSKSTIMWEFSYDFEEDREEIRQGIKTYLEKLDAIDMYEQYADLIR